MIIDELFESPQQCPECGGISFSDLILAEKKDACYHKVKASAKVWPSAYASGRLVQCRKKGAANYGNKSEGVAEAGFPGAPDVEMPPMNPSGDPQRDKLKQEYMDLHREIKSLVDLQYRSTSDEQKMQAKARIEQLNDRADQIKAILEPRQPPNEWQKKTYGFDDNWNKVNQGVAENTAPQLSVQQLATISDAALDKAYGYGRSTPGNTFGWQANLKSAAYAKQMIDQGVTDIEAISDAIHKGWNTTAQAFVQNPDQFDDTAKLAAAGKLEAKLQQRAQLMKQNYAQLPEEEKEKDRVVARALLQAIRGEQPQDVAEDFSAPPQDTTGHGDHIRQTSGGNRNVYRLSQLLRDPSVESYLKIEVPHVSTPSKELIQGIKSKKWEGVDGGRSSIDGPGGWFLTAKNPMYFKEFLQALSQSVSGDKQIRVGIDPYVKNARAQQGMAEGDNMSTFEQDRELAEMLKYAGVPVRESVLTDSTGSTLEHIKDTFRRDVKDFTQSGDMSDALYDALYDYYFDDMPYGTKKARDGDPHEWVADRFADDLGIKENLISPMIMPVSEGSCNMTMEGSYCPEHGLAECGSMYEDGGAVGMPYSMGEEQVDEFIDPDTVTHAINALNPVTGAVAGATLGKGIEKAADWYKNRQEKKALAKQQQQNGVAEGNDDPINSNSAMTGSYYEGKETDVQAGDALLARIKSLALLR